MENDKLIELLGMLIDANQSDVNNAEGSYSECDEAYYQGKITAYNTILEVLVEGK